MFLAEFDVTCESRLAAFVSYSASFGRCGPPVSRVGRFAICDARCAAGPQRHQLLNLRLRAVWRALQFSESVAISRPRFEGSPLGIVVVLPRLW